MNERIEIKTHTRISIQKVWNEGNLIRRKKICDIFNDPYLAQEIRYIVEEYMKKKI